MKQFTMTATNGLGQVICSTRVNGKRTADIAISAKMIEYKAQGYVVINSESSGLFDAKSFLFVSMKNHANGDKVDFMYNEN